MYQKHSDKVVCLSVNLDFEGEDQEGTRQEVLQVLRQQQVTVQNLIQADAELDVQAELDASIPIALVYDQQGKLSKMFHNGLQEYGPHGFTYKQHVIPYVEKLLGQG